MREKLKSVCLTVLSALIIAGGGISLLLNLRNVEAIYQTDTTSYVKVGELYDDASGAMDKDNVGTLIKFITGNTSLDSTNAESALDSLASAETTSADIRANSVTVNGVSKTSEQDIIVTLGGLDWQVVYLSKDNNDNNILTLWLSSSYQSAWEGRSRTEGALYGYLNGSLYSDWSADWSSVSTSVSYPSNMYGTSYVRAVTLNNGGIYATSESESVTAVQSLNSAFARFTMEEANNSLTSFLVTPGEVSWQLFQSAVDEGVNSSTYNNYLLPNDSINDPSGILGGDYNNNSHFGSMNYHDIIGYDAWANDYLWLPSITETGNSSLRNGIWAISTEQRQNISSSTSNIRQCVGSNNENYATNVTNYAWLRSGDYNVPTSMHTLSPLGGGGGSLNGEYSYAIRPALHLNLNAVIESAQPNVYEISLNSNGGAGGASAVWVQEGVGVFADESLTQQITSLANLPTRVGFSLDGYYTADNMLSIKMINGTGTFADAFTTTYFTAPATLYAQWEANNPAYYDEEGGYWYVENGRLPQTRVTDAATISALNANWSALEKGSTYSLGGVGYIDDVETKVYNGEEYYRFGANYYIVEPIRWRLTSSQSQAVGYGTTDDVYAIMDTIVYFGRFTASEYGLGADLGYNDVNNFPPTAIDMIKSNHIDTTYLVTETKSMPTFGTGANLYGDPQNVTDYIFVSSREEIMEVVGTYKIEFSDFVNDYITNVRGSIPLYYTRDLGTNYNHAICLTEDGEVVQRQPDQFYNQLGVQFTIKVSEYA